MLTLEQFIIERHSIYLKRKQGLLAPWTTDPVLQKYFFTNIFRELDKTSILLTALLSPYKQHHKFIANVIIHRIFSNGNFSTYIGFITNFDMFLEQYYTFKKTASPRTSAFISCQSEQELLATCSIAWQLQCTPFQDTKECYEKVHIIHGIGDFLAWQIAQDCFMYGYCTATPDFVILGNGAKLGLSYCNESFFECLYRIRSYMPPWMPPIEIKDLEHALCEYGKYQKLQTNSGKKRIYKQKDIYTTTHVGTV